MFGCLVLCPQYADMLLFICEAADAEAYNLAHNCI